MGPTRRPMPVRMRMPAGILMGVIVGVAMLAGCSGSDDDDAGSSADAAGGGSEAATDGDATQATSVAVDLANTRAPERARDVISTAELTIEAADPEDAAARATVVARDAGGHLFSQEAALADDTEVRAVYKVPPDRFDAVVTALSALGEVQTRVIDTEDVTGQVVDLEARLATARTSVERLRELLTSSGNVGDLLAVEQSLAQREAEMESLAAQLAARRARVDLATISLHVVKAVSASASEVSDDIPGFLAGLRTGAAAFGNSVLVVVTALGFTLPFLALGLVVGLPLWVLTRRRRTAAAHV